MFATMKFSCLEVQKRKKSVLVEAANPEAILPFPPTTEQRLRKEKSNSNKGSKEEME